MIDLDPKQIGKRIKDARNKKNLSQVQLADTLEISKSSLQNYEAVDSKRSDGNKKMNVETLAKIAQCLEVSTDYILGLTNDKHQEPIAVDDLCLTNQEVETLRSLHNDTAAYLFIEDLLSNPKMLHEIGISYLAHWFSYHLVLPELLPYLNSTDSAIKDATERIKIEFSIGDFELPAVPPKDLVDFTRFQVERALLHFIENRNPPSWVHRMEPMTRIETAESRD